MYYKVHSKIRWVSTPSAARGPERKRRCEDWDQQRVARVIGMDRYAVVIRRKDAADGRVGVYLVLSRVRALRSRRRWIQWSRCGCEINAYSVMEASSGLGVCAEVSWDVCLL